MPFAICLLAGMAAGRGWAAEADCLEEDRALGASENKASVESIRG
jgi:hypothetical protein